MMDMELARLHLDDAVRQPGCPVCWLRERWVGDYMHQVLTDYVVDGHTQKALSNSRGWCSVHAWELQAACQREWNDGNKIAMLYENASLNVQALLRKYLDGMPQEAPQDAKAQPKGIGAALRGLRRPRVAAGLLEKLRPIQKCPVCAMIERKEKLLLYSLMLNQTAYADLERSDGLCLPHLLAALQVAANENIARRLVWQVHQRLTTLHTHLDEYIEKHRWQEDRALRTPSEEASWLRMVAFFAGEAPHAVEPAIEQQREHARNTYERWGAEKRNQ